VINYLKKEIKHEDHIPVLGEEVKFYLNIREGRTYVDGTFGGGGHSSMILSAAKCNLYSIDRDPKIKIYAKKLKKKYPNNFKLIEGNIGNLKSLLKGQGVDQIDGGILFDLGVSSMQLDNADRGFSFRYDGPLDMRMGLNGPTAAEIIEKSDENTISDIIYKLGEEPKSRKIAKAIVSYKNNKTIESTIELAEIVRNSIGYKKNRKIDPATKTFQAFRIKVNNELEEIKSALEAAKNLLVPGARLVVISFHSLEDKIVKNFLKTYSGLDANPYRHSLNAINNLSNKNVIFNLLTKNVIKISNEENKINIRARSARLRAAEKICNIADVA
tara:strand:- start:10329 stop:11315 length:987 start_codon:yes stop_codon:yes gene_type:complete